jgi:hypothetical protein
MSVPAPPTVTDNYYPIIKGVAARLQANVQGIPPVDARYELELFDGEQTPLVLVAGDQEGPHIRKRTFGFNNWWVYPVYVALVTPKNQAASKGLSDYLALCFAIRAELYQVQIPGVTAVFDTRIKPRPISKFAATVRTNYKVTGWAMAYTTQEIAKG